MRPLARLTLVAVLSLLSLSFFWLMAQEAKAAHFIEISTNVTPTDPPAIPQARGLRACLATVTVTSSADSGPGTLRQALIDVCSGGTINFASSLANQTIVVTSTELIITKTVAITNPTASNLKISGNNTHRVWNIQGGAVVTISNLSVISGTANSNHGGGIFNAGSLTLNSVVFQDNRASLNGGAIYNSGALVLNYSSLSGSRSPGNGGGIFNHSNGIITIYHSTISNSRAVFGGAIYNEGIVTLSNSTLSYNNADEYGAGINNRGVLAVGNSTLSYNSAVYRGGGIYNEGSYSNYKATINNSTLSHNSSSRGGGIYNLTLSSLYLSNSIVANSLGGGDCYNDGIIQLNLNNLIENGSCNAAFNGDPNLGPLQDNGGFILTHALLAPSPALDAGDPATCLTTDQRNVSRPLDSNGDGPAICDLGAFEAPTAPPSPNMQVWGNGSLIFDGDKSPSLVDHTNFGNFVPGGSPIIRTFIISNTGPANLHLTGSPLITLTGSIADFNVTVFPTTPIGPGEQTSFLIGFNPANPTNFNLRSASVTIATNDLDSNPYTFDIQGNTCLSPVTVSSVNDNGPGTLRQALTDVCNGGLVNFAAGLSNQTITLTSAELAITKTVTITNPNASNLKISGNNVRRIFNIKGGAVVTISSLSIISGTAIGGCHYENCGGGILNEGTLTVNNSLFSGNSADAHGGGIYSSDTTILTINDSIFNGNSATNGGGLFTYGTSTIKGSTFNNNSASSNSTGVGGGIANYGTSIITNTMIKNNYSGDNGGGLTTGNHLTLANSVISNNFSGGSGGGIRNSKVLTVTNSIISNNSASGAGGGMDNTFRATVNNSTFNGNSAVYDGGGIQSQSLSELIVSNSTFSGNSANNGGGIHVYNGTMTLKNNTFSGNLASGISGLDLHYGNAYLYNNIIADGSNNLDCSQSFGTITVNLNNLVEDGSCNAAFSGDPGLGSLQDNGGVILPSIGQAPFTHALSPTSNAIDAGDEATCLAVDQRNINRPIDGNGDSTAICDLGAFEAPVGSPSPELTVWGNLTPIADGDTTPSPLDHTEFEPVSIIGGIVTHTFALSNTGFADLLLTGSPLITITGDTTDFILTLPSDTSISPGDGASFQVAFDPIVTGLRQATLFIASNDPNENPYNFTIQGTGTCAPALTVIGNSDSGPGTFRQALIDVCNGGQVDFAPGLADHMITLTSGQLYITKTVTITNPYASNLKISGNSSQRVFNIQAGAVVTVSNFSIINSVAPNTGSGCPTTNCGGGIYNNGVLTLYNITMSHNSAINGPGGAIYNYEKLTVNHSIFNNNSSNGGGSIFNNGTVIVNNSIISGNTASYYGGGLYNNGILTVNRSTIKNNSAMGGAGIYNDNFTGGLTTVDSSTLSGNSASEEGGAILNTSSNSVTVKNSTISGNSAPYGGGIRNYHSSSTLTIDNSTFSNNSAWTGGGINNYSGILHLRNTIIANSSGGDCYNGFGTIATNLKNLIENGSCSPAFSGDPNLGALKDNGGPTPTHALLPGSPAINAGDNASCLAIDQRGIARPQVGHCDIGAFESQGFVLAVNGGNNQVTSIGQPFDLPLKLTVTSQAGNEPVDGGLITFTAPPGGPSTTFAPQTRATISAGAVALNVTANMFAGTPYTVVANTSGGNSVNFSLTNNKITPTVMIISSHNPSVYGQIVTFTATVSSNLIIPTGNVIFIIDGVAHPAVPVVNKKATFSIAGLAVGVHTVEAAYSGDDQLYTGSGMLTNGQTVVPEATPLVQFAQAIYTDTEKVGTTLIITLERTGNLNPISQVQVNLSGGTASAGVDYISAGFPLTLTFGSGVVTQIVAIPIVDDTLTEPVETISLTMMPLNNVLIGPQGEAVLRLVDDDPAPAPTPLVQFTQAVYTDTEKAGSILTVTLSRTGNLSQTSQVEVSLSGGTAGEGTDYNGTGFPLTLTFGPGVASKAVPIPIIDDTLVEPVETISLTITGLSNAQISAQNKTLLRLMDNDPAASPAATYLPFIIK